MSKMPVTRAVLSRRFARTILFLLMLIIPAGMGWLARDTAVKMHGKQPMDFEDYANAIAMGIAVVVVVWLIRHTWRGGFDETDSKEL